MFFFQLYFSNCFENNYTSKYFLTHKVYLITTAAFAGNTLAYLNDDGSFLSLIHNVVEIKGNDLMMVAIDTSLSRQKYSLLKITDSHLYPEDVLEINSIQYDSISRSMKIKYHCN